MAKKQTQKELDLKVECALWFRNLRETNNRTFLPLFWDEHRYLVLKGGGGSGKSIFAGRKILERAITEPGHRFLVCRKVARTLRESCFKQLLGQLADFYPDSGYKPNKSDLMLPELFNISPSNHWGEKFTTMTAMEGFQPVGENGDYPVDGMQEGFSKFLEHMTWKNSFSLSREIVEDGKLMDLKKQPAGFITSYYRTREKFGAALLGAAITGATSTKFYGKTFSTLGADGKCLFAKEHPSALGKKKQSNLFADGFSNDALAAAESAMQDFRGDNEEVLDVAPTTILIPNEYTLKRDVFAAIGADKDPNTANNGFNFNFGRWNVIVWPYLNQFITAGTKPWVLLDSKYNEEYGGAVWLDRVALEVRSELAGNDANVWKGYARFIAGFNDWRAFCVGGVTGGTQLIATSTGG